MMNIQTKIKKKKIKTNHKSKIKLIWCKIKKNNKIKQAWCFFYMKKMIVDLQIFTLQKFYKYNIIYLKKGNGNWFAIFQWIYKAYKYF